MEIKETKEKKVSFVVPVYKTEQYLKNCLKSLLDQDYKNIEIVVVLDGNSEEARRIALSFKDNRISIHCKEHGGVQKARNDGFVRTSGDFVSFWDSDCYAEPGMARMWVKIFNMYPDVGFVYSGYRFTSDDVVESEIFDPYVLTCENYISTMFPMRRELFPGFDENLESLQDWDLWLTLSERGHKGFMLQGTAFKTEIREGISSKGCSDEEWLNRYNKVREKHGITGRDVCYTSIVAPSRAKEIARFMGADYRRMPGYHPNEYKEIHVIGFYPQYSQEQTIAFKKGIKDCKRVIHWLGEDIEQWLMQPYRGVVAIVNALNQTIHKHYVENDVAKKFLKELGLEAEILPLPMEYKEVPMPKEFAVYYEDDAGSRSHVQEIVKSCPDIKFSNSEVCELKDFACFLSLTNSAVPSENLKRFAASGRFIITNYMLPYAGYLDPSREAVVEAIRQAKRDFKEGKVNKEAMDYYQKLISLEDFKKRIG